MRGRKTKGRPDVMKEKRKMRGKKTRRGGG
jgi:hypothetical protein